MKSLLLILSTLLIITFSYAQDGKVPPGFVSLFNGKDLNEWKIPEGDGGHWKVLNGVIDYDALREAQDKNLWSKSLIKILNSMWIGE